MLIKQNHNFDASCAVLIVVADVLNWAHSAQLLILAVSV